MQTEAVRLAVDAASVIQSISTVSAAASMQPWPPATISVSMSAGASRRRASGVTIRPLDVRSGAPSRLRIRTS